LKIFSASTNSKEHPLLRDDRPFPDSQLLEPQAAGFAMRPHLLPPPHHELPGHRGPRPLWGGIEGRGEERPRGAGAGRLSGAGSLAPSSIFCRKVPVAKDAARPWRGRIGPACREEVGGRGMESIGDGRRMPIIKGEQQRGGEKRIEPSSPSDDPLLFQRRLHLGEVPVSIL